MHRLMDWLGGEEFAASLVPLEAISDETRLREIIVRPASDSGVAVQPELLAELLPAAHEMAGALPLLALTLSQLFARRDPASGLTLAGYQSMGGLPKIVESAAAGIDQEIDDDPLLAEACERLFAELATVIDELPTRRTAAVEPLRADTRVSVLVDSLRAQGLLADPDERHVELAHETLLKHWPRLREWCKRYADKLALRRQAEQAAGDWQKARTREEESGQALAVRHSDLLRWTWERQKPALLALLALSPQLSVQHYADFADAGIDAWRALQAVLSEPLRSFLAPEPLRLLDELRSDDTPQQRREEIGLRLNQMGDARRGVGVDAAGLPDLVWVEIPASQVNLETEPLETVPVHTFRIARYPITWQQYRAFVDAADGYYDPRWWNGLKHEDQPGADRWAFASYPAINVSWYDALAFCRWLSKRLALAEGEVVRLPTEWEWQWVAQAGTQAQKYPWRGEWNTMRANSNESGIGRTTAVGMYPPGAPDCWPVLDLAGNVREWCLNPHKKPGRAYVSRLLRGGSWSDSPWDCLSTNRKDDAPFLRNNFIGFRVCRGAPIEPPQRR
nr:formylglycine-generating enzyme family protein [Candidatus Accumulibacter sp. ACC003]